MSEHNTKDSCNSRHKKTVQKLKENLTPTLSFVHFRAIFVLTAVQLMNLRNSRPTWLEIVHKFILNLSVYFCQRTLVSEDKITKKCQYCLFMFKAWKVLTLSGHFRLNKNQASQKFTVKLFQKHGKKHPPESVISRRNHAKQAKITPNQAVIW